MLKMLAGRAESRLQGALRRLAYTNYGTAKLYYRHGLARQLARSSGMEVLVYQMGKVGSTAVAASLRAARPDLLCWHAHTLKAEPLADEERTFRGAWSGARSWNPHTTWQSQFIRERLLSAEGPERWRIVTLVRDPVARNVSAFFEILEYELGFEYSRRVRSEGLGSVVRDLRDRFWSDFTGHTIPLRWFDEQLRAFFGIDVFSSDFDKARGYQTYSGERADVLVLKLERLESCFEAACRDFLGIGDAKLLKKNVGKEKRYADAYVKILDTMEMPGSYLEAMYDSKYARHFYSDDELGAFRARWGSDSELRHGRGPSGTEAMTRVEA